MSNPLRRVKVAGCLIASAVGIATAVVLKIVAADMHLWATAVLLTLAIVPALTLRTRWVSAAYMTAGFLVLGLSFFTVIGVLLLPMSGALVVAGALRDSDPPPDG